ncbi:MAG: DoxX family protein [Bacteroidetes bacterium]|nr:DoxX family protein [Bacteroidota bacterium]
MNKFLSPNSLMQGNGIALIRILVGIFLIYHGSEIFDAVKMKEYTTWEVFKKNSSSFMPYLGKGAELLAGILLAFGLFTRIACMIIIGTMGYIAFVVGNGKIWYEDQYPFLFVVLAFVFIFTGPGNFSADKIFFKKISSNK